jgi:glycosyltransferase 2 family protein
MTVPKTWDRNRLLARRLVARRFLRPLVSLGILAVLIRFMDGGTVLAALLAMDMRWIPAALGITLLQVALLGWRWRYTAARLGLHLPLPAAMAEYYRSLFLNQVLPGGVLGDVSRAWRHARDTPEAAGVAVRGVVLERASGQAVMTGWAAVSFLLLSGTMASGGLVLLLGLAVVVGGWGMRRRRHPLPAVDSLGGRIWRDARRAVLSGPALPVHLVSGALLVASFVGVFLLAALAVGAETAPLSTALLAAPVLMAMLIPVGWAGWGVREAAAAGLWGLAGLPPSEGVLISMAYGTLVLLASLPGGLLLLSPRRNPPEEEGAAQAAALSPATPALRTPGRRGHPGPA